MRPGDALIVVDVQKDFLPNGSLAAPEGNKILKRLYEVIRLAKKAGVCVVATRDYHPANHMSFKAQGGPWPVHCVQGSKGAEFSEGFPVELIDIEIQKGTEASKEAYSGFEDTDLKEQLKTRNIKKVYAVGLTTEYCVWSTARDALQNGFDTVVLEDLIAEVVPSAKTEKLNEMKANGIKIMSSTDLSF